MTEIGFDPHDVSIQTSAPFVHFGGIQTPDGAVTIDTIVTYSGTVLTRINGEYKTDHLTEEPHRPRHEDHGFPAPGF